MGKTIKNNLSDKLGLPGDVMLGEVNIRLCGNTKVYIENYRYIIEYSEGLLKIQCRHIRIKIVGERLLIDYFTKEEMLVRGLIQEISYY